MVSSVSLIDYHIFRIFFMVIQMLITEQGNKSTTDMLVNVDYRWFAPLEAQCFQ